MDLQTEIMPLDKVLAGTTVTLSRIDAGRELRNRLTALGLLPNSQITVLRNFSQGQIIVRVKDTKIVLGRGMANKVWVS